MMSMFKTPLSPERAARLGRTEASGSLFTSWSPKVKGRARALLKTLAAMRHFIQRPFRLRMMTDRQLEIAAREYCRLTNLDPEEEIGHSPAPIPTGASHTTSVHWPRWKVVAEKISQIDIMQHCMGVGKSAAVPSERGSSISSPDVVSARLQRIFSWLPEPRPGPQSDGHA